MTDKITRAQKALQASEVLATLKPYSPEVVSTIFVGLDTNNSDIDIVCTYQDQQAFVAHIESAFSDFESFSVSARNDYAVAKFYYEQFLFEIYASTTPVQLQAAFRHYQVMKRLVNLGGNEFIQQVRHLKESGLKTEPAICHVLGISGEPYAAVLELEQWSDIELKARLDPCLK